ncbi:hypothetical protein SOVF_115930 [Spinacia oleracea]|nr:hypothetical protein SOVF_115930 [Spinacia oleracea]
MHDEEQKYGINGSKVIEPQGTELLSALAAGNKAKTIIDITTSKKQGITPLTLALSVAAKQTGGKLICIRPSLNGVINNGVNYEVANDVTELRVGDPCEQLMNDIRNVDFAVIDCRDFDTCRLRVLSEKLHLNPKGAIIVANNVLHREQGVALVDQILKGKKGGIESSVRTLPLGGSSAGFQLIIKIKSKCQKIKRKHRRFFVTFDD